MASTFKKGQEIATIDIVLATVVTHGDSPLQLAFETASKVQVDVQIETKEAVKLIVKGKLIAQKAEENTITGNKLTFTDNVFNPVLAKIFQGGTITYDEEGNFKKYAPPVVGSDDKGEPFDLTLYSAHYDASGLILDYEKVTYPNCQGAPFGVGAEDGVFAVPEYTINSAPGQGQAPFELEMVDELPKVQGVFGETDFNSLL